MKRKLAIALLCFSMFNSSMNFSHAAAIEDFSKESVLGSGIIYKQLNSFTEDGVQNVNMLILDLNNPNVKLDLIFNQNGFSQRATLSQMVQQDGNVLAAVNGDFFSMSNPAFSLGPMVKDGKLLSNPHYELNKYSTALVDSNNNVFFAYLNPTTYAGNVTRGVNTPIAAVNKPSPNYANIVAYTTEYRRNSPGANDKYYDLTEVVVENNVVREVRFGQPSVAIPENGFVMVAGGANSYVLQNSFAPGDSVALNTDINLNYPSTKTSLGGGTMILKNGELTPLTQSVKGKSQRTALGLTYDNKLLVITIDGRKAPFIGMEERDVAAYLRSMGCKDGMLLDGGGSTQMIVEGETKNTMVSGERPLVNGFAVKASQPKGAASNVEITLPYTSSFAGEPMEIEPRVYDTNGNSLGIPRGSFSYAVVDGNGRFEGNKFIGSSTGTVTISASYGGVTGTKTIDVIGSTSADPLKVDALPAGGTNISVLGDMSSSNRTVDSMMYAKLQDAISKTSQRSILIGNGSTVFDNGLKVPHSNFGSGFTKTSIGDALLVAIDGNNGGLYTKRGQWDFIKEALNSSEKNIFIVTNQEGFNLPYQREKDLFRRTLFEKSREKNIFLVSRGNSFTQRVEGNVRYITVPDYVDMTNGNLSNDFRCLTFNLGANGVTYSYNPVF